MYDIRYARSSFYLVLNNLEECFKKSGKDKYLFFTSADKNKTILQKYEKLFNEIKRRIKLMDNDEIRY